MSEQSTGDSIEAPRLDGHVALVTGGAAGIGFGIARGLARAGAQIAILEVDADRGEQARELLGEYQPLIEQVDVSDGDALRSSVRHVAATFGRLDVVVNNAGGTTRHPFISQSENSWRRHIDLNLRSVLVTTAEAIPVMIRSGRGGRIVNVVSIEAFRAAPGHAVYAACKAGVVSLTKSLAVELAEHGIRVNAIAPDWIRTPGSSGVRSGRVGDEVIAPRPPAMAEGIARYVPLGYEGSIDHCASVAVFLASAMSDYVTGTTLHVDGGTFASSGWRRTDGSWALW